jgi:AsmA protein
MKKLIKILGILSLSFLVLLIAAFFILKALFPPAKLREMVEPRIEKAIEREIEIGDIGIAFSWGFGIRLDDLVISNRKGFSENDFLKVDRILLRINLRPLLQRQLQVNHVILEKPEILVERNKKGEFNFGDWQKRRESLEKAVGEEEKIKRMPDAGFAFFLTSLKVNDGTLIYDDHLTNRTLKISHYNQNLSLALEGENFHSEGGASIGDLKLITPLFPVTGFKFDIDESIFLDLAQNRLVIEKFEVKTGDLSFPFSGSIEELGEEPKVDLTLQKMGIEVEKLLSIVPPPFSENITNYSSDGSIDINLQVKSTQKAKPSVEGSFTLHDLGFRGGNLKQPLSNVQGNIDFAWNPKRAQFNAPSVTGKVGQTSFTFSGKGTQASKPRMTFDLNMDKIVGEDWMTPPGTQMSEPVGTEMTSLPPFFPNLNGNIGIDAIHFKMLKLENFKGKVSVENGFFQMTNGICDIYGGKGKGDFSMDLNDLTKRQFNTDLNMTGVEVNDLFSSITPLKDIFHGQVEGNLVLSGAGSKPDEIRKTLSGNGFGRLSGGKIENLDLQEKLSQWTKKDFFKSIALQDLSLSYNMKRGDLFFDNLTIFGKKADWLMAGKIGLDKSIDWDVTCRLSSAVSQGFGVEGLPQLFKDSEGRVVLDFLVGGTLENPKFAWNTSKTKDRVEKRISAEIEKKQKESEEKVKKELQKKKEEVNKELEKKKEDLKKELEEKAKEKLKKLFPGK